MLKTRLDRTKILMINGSLMKVESIAECSKGSILQYFWPALSNNWSWIPIFCLFVSDFTVHMLTQVNVEHDVLLKILLWAF